MIRVMSFNIRYGTADDGVFRWENRKSAVIERIRAFQPDLLGLQECRDDEQAAYIRAELPEFSFIGVRRGGPGEPGLEMAPVLVRTSAFQILDHGTFWVSDTPDLPASKHWGAYFPRTATWVALQKQSPPYHTLTFANTHLDYAPGVSYPSMQVLQDQLKQRSQGGPLVLAGDFNTLRGSRAFRRLVEPDDQKIPVLIDTATAIPTTGPASGTFHDFGRITPPLPLDWVLASPHFSTQAAGVDQTQPDGVYPSDHYPIYAVVSLEGD